MDPTTVQTTMSARNALPFIYAISGDPGLQHAMLNTLENEREAALASASPRPDLAEPTASNEPVCPNGPTVLTEPVCSTEPPAHDESVALQLTTHDHSSLMTIVNSATYHQYPVWRFFAIFMLVYVLQHFMTCLIIHLRNRASDAMNRNQRTILTIAGILAAGIFNYSLDISNSAWPIGDFVSLLFAFFFLALDHSHSWFATVRNAIYGIVNGGPFAELARGYGTLFRERVWEPIVVPRALVARAYILQRRLIFGLLALGSTAFAILYFCTPFGHTIDYFLQLIGVHGLLLVARQFTSNILAVIVAVEEEYLGLLRAFGTAGRASLPVFSVLNRSIFHPYSPFSLAYGFVVQEVSDLYGAIKTLVLGVYGFYA